MSVRVRFAPSPTGPLHLGNARTALFNWLFARKRAGQFLLRIEDTDPERTAPGAEAAIVEDLRWLGLDWDEEIVRQSARLDRFRAAAEELVRRGAAYPCFCSPEALEAERREQSERGLPPRYAGRCRGIGREEAARRRAAGMPAAVRFAMPPDTLVVHDVVKGAVHFSGRELGDFVVLREDGTPTYNLAAVVDDAAMRITHVIRGEDHLANTPRQIALGRALGWAVPAFAHLPLIHGQDGSPLSKRHGAVAVSDHRDAGLLSEALVNHLALLGWSPPRGHDEVLGLDRLVHLFALDRVARSPARFDPERLAWFNRQHLRRLRPEELAGRLRLVPDPLTLRALDAIRRDACTVAEAADLLDPVLHPRPSSLDTGSASLLRVLAARLSDGVAGEEEAQVVLARATSETGASRRAVMQVLRQALTGADRGLPVATLVTLLGADEVRRRIAAALDRRSETGQP